MAEVPIANWAMFEDDDKTLLLHVLDSTGTASQDITGGTVRMIIDTLGTLAGSISNPTAGSVVFTVLPSFVANPANYPYYVTVNFNNGKISTVLQGTSVIKRRIP